MRKFIRGAAAALAVAAIAISAQQAQAASATANVSANIIAAIAVTKTADLNFGSVVPTSTAGTVALTSANAISSTLTITGAHSTAAFNVTGGANQAYSVSLPSSATLSDGASHTMTVDTFTSSVTSGTLNSSGASSFNVGATLRVGANQAAGAYTGTFNVTVAYN